MSTAEILAKRNKKRARIEKESKVLLDNEKDYKMDKRQKTMLEKYKKLAEDNGCELVSTAYIATRTKMVIKCAEDSSHDKILMAPDYMATKAKHQNSLCASCNIIEAWDNRKNAEIKEAKEIKQKEAAELTPEQIKQKDIEFFASDKPLAEKKERVRILNADKGGSRMDRCIEEGCFIRSGYGHIDFSTHCWKHKLDDQKVISREPCCLCDKCYYDYYDGKRYCLDHAIELGFRAPNRSWIDYFNENNINIEHLRRMKYNSLQAKKIKLSEGMEQFIADLLKAKILHAKVDHVGYKSNPMFDIEIAFADNIWRGIQVRTITKKTGSDNYWTFDTTHRDSSIDSGKTKYPDDTLFIACNNEKSLFVSIYSQDIEAVNFNYSSADLQHKFARNVFTNIDEFVICVETMARNAIPIKGLKLRGSTWKKEYRMMKMIEELRPDFQQNKQVFSAIDCFINNWNIQCKFSSSGRDGHVFSVSVSTAVRTKPGKVKYVPYDLHNNIDFIIIYLESKTSRKKYKGNFLIIPRSALISLGVFQTPTQSGKVSLYVPSPDYWKGKFHPLFQYWNKWELLSEKKDKLDYEETRQKYAESELDAIHAQEAKERIEYLSSCLAEARTDFLSVRNKIISIDHKREDIQSELNYLGSIFDEKLNSYQINLKEYLRFHDYRIWSAGGRMNVYKFFGRSKVTIGSNTTLGGALKIAKYDLLKNFIINHIPISPAKIVISYFGDELY